MNTPTTALTFIGAVLAVLAWWEIRAVRNAAITVSSEPGAKAEEE
jgi:hypothetical protein